MATIFSDSQPDSDQSGRAKSIRLSSVWNSAEKRQETPLNGKGSPDFLANGVHKRREAVAWLQSLGTGAELPAEDDRAFRASLADGSLLCKVALLLAPESIKTIHEVKGTAHGEYASASQQQQRYENVQNFIRVVRDMNVPADFTFSYEDLTNDSDPERPAVTNCILWLKRLYEGHNGATPLTHQGSNDLSPMLDSSRKAYPGSGGAGGRASGLKGSNLYPSLVSPAASAAAAATGAPPSHTSPPAAPVLQQQLSTSTAAAPLSAASGDSRVPGVAQLLTQWSMILKAQSSTHSIDVTSTNGHQVHKFNAHSSELSVESMGPVFHNVLSSITTDYERKLSAKDQEVSKARESVNNIQAQMLDVQRQLRQMQEQLEAQQQGLDEGQHAAVAELQVELQRLQAELAESHRRYAELQWQYNNVEAAAQERTQGLRDEVEAMRERLEQYDSMEGRYRSARDENRRLYNMVQDLKGSIRVYCRIRPRGLTGDPSGGCIEVGEDGELAVHDPTGRAESKLYRFDKIFQERSSQSEVYEDTQPLIRSVLDGYNVCIFAYGQTGSGKTHTMSGTNVEDEQGRGINYRALYDLFDLVEERRGEMEYTIKVQMLEIYNESLRDLLRDPRLVSMAAQQQGGNGGGLKLELLNTMPSGCNVKNAEQVDVHSPDMVLELMRRGARNRHVAETDMNERSSRSHQVLTVIVDGVNLMSGAATHACLNLVDLAGSERVKQSNATGDRLVETRNINSSLSALGDVMAALAKRDAHIPFRNSKLTALLADSLSGAAKVMMLMHISPEANFLLESVSTLQFGSKVSSVALGQAKRNVDNSKLLANEELLRFRKEASDREELVTSLQKKYQEERRQRELAAKAAEQATREIERLKAQLEAARRGGSSTYGSQEAPMSTDSMRSMSRAQEQPGGFATPSQRPPQVKPLIIPTSQPAGYGTPAAAPSPTASAASVATPSSARLRGATYAAANAAHMQRMDSARKAERGVPQQAQLQQQQLGRTASGALTARQLADAQSRPPSMSARPGGVFGVARSAASSSSMAPPPAAPPLSMRTSGVHGMPPMGSSSSSFSLRSNMSSTARAAAVAAAVGAAGGSASALLLPGASAGGRRSSVGQWRS